MSTADINFLVSSAQNAVANGATGTPENTLFTAIVDAEGEVQPLIIQLQKAKLGNYVWLDADADGIQDANEAGVNNVVVELYDGNGHLLATTTTGDDLSTAAVESGYYQFTGLAAGNYQVKFIAPSYQFTSQDANGNTQDALDSDANGAGFSQIVTLAAGQSNQTIDAGVVLPPQKASLGDYVWLDNNQDGQQNDGAASGVNGVVVNLLRPDGTFVATTTTADDGSGNPGYYLFSNLVPGDYKVEFVKPAGYTFTTADQGSDGGDSDADVSTGQTISTTLVAGENDLSWDAGLLKLASLGDKVWEDKNANGQQDDGEPGIDGVTVRLYNCVTNELVATQVTANGGIYNFTGLPPGTYHVVFETPNGFVQTQVDVGGDATDSDAGVGGVTGCYTLASGDNNTTVDAGFYRTASLGNYVWLDDNNNGVQDEAAAKGVNGVVVNLLRPDGTFVATTTTANDGSGNPGYYLFSNLVPGDYKVEFIKPAGYIFAKQDQGGDASDSDADTTTGVTISTTLESGENDLSWDAGLLKLASLGDKVWEDKNANGQQDDGEPGIDGVTVRLYNCVTNELVATQVTANGGIYNFTGLPPGTYHVVFETPNGFVQTQVDVGGDATDSDAGVGGVTGCYTLASGDNNTTVDAGFYRTASLGNYVWLDDNNNGVQDEAAAKGVNGVVVNLLRPDGTFVATTTTADDGSGNPGYYLFSNLVPGDYKVEFIKPAGYIFAKQDQGGDASDSDADTTTGVTISTTLESGENDLSWDAGLLKLASLGDKVWEDKNANGQQDDGEPGIDGVTVRLYNCVTNELVATQVTANGGIYNFTGLPPGTYHVVFETPNGFVQTQVDVGGDATDSDAGAGGVTGCYTLASGDNNTTVDAGFYKLASLGDYVWADNNLNGLQDDGQTGVNGVTVRLLRPDGTVVATTVTANDANNNPGYYFFGNLVPGDYKVEFVKPAGYAFTSADQGANDGTDSDANTSTGQTIVTTLVSGENDLSWDAGLVKLASLGDYVWEDKNADGIQNDGATGINGVTVRLLRPDGTLVATTVTATNAGNAGYYFFGDLLPGDYKVEFVKPNGYSFSSADQGGNDGLDSDANVNNGQTITTTLTAGENDLSWDAGLYKLASLGDYVWADNNLNGLQDDGQTGVNGVTVRLLRPDGTVVATTTTANDGSGNPGYYLFSNLVPGDYKVEFVKPAGYAFTSADQGANDGTDSDANTSTGQTIVTTLVSGENDLSWDAGLVKLASLGDYVWEDKNADGIQNDGATGINGVTVRLLRPDGTLVATTVTATNAGNAGYYFFGDLLPGDYKVEFVKPTGYKFTTADVGADGLDSDANVSTGQTITTTLTAGENDLSWDAGLVKLATCATSRRPPTGRPTAIRSPRPTTTRTRPPVPASRS
ncbi:MAG: SdrD B-like domain-containing protein [Rhodoferax sp.]